MKKLIALLLAMIMVMGLVACGNNTDTTGTTDDTTQDTTAATDEILDDTTAEVQEPNDATAVLSAIWAAVPEENRFFAMGGDVSAMVDNDAGNYSLSDEGLTASLYVPADQIKSLRCASSLMHAMLQNNFTCGVYQMGEGGDANAFADAMKESIGSAQWICGMPEKMIIAVIDGEYVLAAFGINDAITPFETALGAVYADAEIVYNEPIAG